MIAPKSRSRLRIFVGSALATIRTWLFWLLFWPFLASKKQAKPLPFLIATHQTPLRRPLPNDETWLQDNKINNLKLAIQRLNGCIIKPSQLFSYWFLIGNPTRAKGYKAGMILHQGTVQSGIGGGLCQLSNLLYWMTLHTPLTVCERWRHGYDVFPDTNRTQPFGSGATCFYPFLDLKLKNNTTACFQLCLRLTETHLIGEWRSDQPLNHAYQVYETDHRMELAPWGGYVRSNTLRRRQLHSTGALQKDELLTRNEAIMMYSPFLEGK